MDQWTNGAASWRIDLSDPSLLKSHFLALSSYRYRYRAQTYNELSLTGRTSENNAGPKIHR
jgi:hypothetical protein